MKTIAPNGAVIGSAAVPGGGMIVACVPRGSKSWKQSVSVAPTSIAVDPHGNVLYAGTASGPEGKFIVLGLLDASGRRVWAQRIDGAGEESNPVVKVAPGPSGGVYVFGGSSGLFQNQLGTAKGHRFVAKNRLDGAQGWLLQSVDFGKPTTTEFNPQDQTPSVFNVDAHGNVYILSTLEVEDATGSKPITMGNLVKLAPNGALLWRKPVVLDVRSHKNGNLTYSEFTNVAVSEDARSVYLIGAQSNGMNIIMVKMGSDGAQQWSQIVSIQHRSRSKDGSQSSGADDWGSRGTVVRGDAVYVLSAYHNFYNFEGVKDYENTAALSAFRASDGRRKWLREYRSGEPSEILSSNLQILPSGGVVISAYDEFVSSLFLVTDVQTAPAKPAHSAATPPAPSPAPAAAGAAEQQPNEGTKAQPKPATAPVSKREKIKGFFKGLAPKQTGSTTSGQPSQSAALPPPEGDFFSEHEVSEYDAMSGEDIIHELCDVVTIKEAANGALNVKLNTVGRNFSECFLDATMASAGPNEWRWTAAPTESDCVVVLKQTKTEIDINPSDACSYYCGVGAYLGATFPVSSRRPVGSYEWPER